MDIKEKIKEEDQNISIGINAQDREKVAELLSYLLADEHVLYIKLRNYHWNVEGIEFGPLHALFEEQYTELAEHIDDIAERIRSIGAYAPASMEAYRSITRLKETDHLNGNARKMLQNLLADNEFIIQVLRQNVEDTIKYNDAGTSDFLTGLMEAHEKAAWMLRAHLK